MTLAGENHHSPLMPSRRRVVQAAAWSVPAISLAAASPAFASSPGAEPADLVTFTSGLFWRPQGAEIPAGETLYWGFIPADTVIWITQVTNPGTSPVENVQLDLAVPPDAVNNEFTVLNASDVAVSPDVFATTQRPANGRVIVTLPQVPVATPVIITVALERPASVARLSTASWPLTVTPPGSGQTASLPITTYAQFLADA